MIKTTPHNPRPGKAHKSKPLYKCSANPSHKFAENHAKTTKWFCPTCGYPLKARKQKIDEMKALAKQLGYKCIEISNYE